MSEQTVITHCAPTLAGLKTGSLFCCAKEDGLWQELQNLNQALNPKGVCFVPLCEKEDRVFIYVYRPRRLAQDMARQEAQGILLQCGYPEGKEGGMGLLAQRLKQAREFPHEIGLFLGYPPCDVKGFMEHGGRDCKCCGYWKVYGDMDQAQKMFERFRKCTKIYLDLFHSGVPMTKLTVGERSQ